MIGQLFGGRSSIRIVDSISYADPDPLVGAIRRKWILRLRRAVAALEAVPIEITRRFERLHAHRLTLVPTIVPIVGESITLRYGGIHA